MASLAKFPLLAKTSAKLLVRYGAQSPTAGTAEMGWKADSPGVNILLMIKTRNLRLVLWGEQHRAAFAAMHADPVVMADQNGPIDPTESDAKFDRYRLGWIEEGVSRWAIENRDGSFLGYTGVVHRLDEAHPLGAHFEIGWRLVVNAWGHGYATESAQAALLDAVARVRPSEILTYTSPDNLRSQAVMSRLKLRRMPKRDFVVEKASGGVWQGLVWQAHAGAQ